MREEYDAIVLGGGYFGCSAAYHLSKSGIHTLLVEKNEIASGASGANFGNVQVQDSNMGLSLEMTLEGFRRMRNMEKELGLDIGYTACTSMIVAEKEEHIPGLRQLYEEKKEAGLDIHWLEGKEVNEAEPNLAIGEVKAATCYEQGRIYPFRYLFALVKRAKEFGLEVAERTEAAEILVEGGACAGIILKDDRTVRARIVIAAGGSGTTEICRTAGLTVPIFSAKSECFVTEPIGPFLRHDFSSAAFFADAHNGKTAATALCAEQSLYGNILIAETTKPYELVKPEYNDLCSPEQRENIRDLILRFFPSLAGIQILRSWCVPSPATPTFEPVLGESPVPGLIVDAGFKSAVVMSAVSGSIVADLANGKTPAFDLSGFTSRIQKTEA